METRRIALPSSRTTTGTRRSTRSRACSVRVRSRRTEPTPPTSRAAARRTSTTSTSGRGLGHDVSPRQGRDSPRVRRGRTRTAATTFIVLRARPLRRLGDAIIGFWFLQDNISLGANGTFTGQHTNGDIFVLSATSLNGGSVSEIKVYEWLNGGLSLKDSGPNATGPATKRHCATVNAVTDRRSPWPFLNKSGSNDFAAGELLRGWGQPRRHLRRRRSLLLDVPRRDPFVDVDDGSAEGLRSSATSTPAFRPRSRPRSATRPSTSAAR